MASTQKWYRCLLRVIAAAAFFAPLPVLAHNTDSHAPAAQDCALTMHAGNGSDSRTDSSLPTSGTHLYCHHFTAAAQAVGKVSRQDSDDRALETYPGPRIRRTLVTASVFEPYHPAFTARPSFILYRNFRS